MLAKKMSGYKSQDKHHEIYSERHFVSVAEVEKMLATKKCVYCLEDVLTEFAARDERQWTLDRIDNRMGHNRGNVVLSCLKCNLKRGNICSSESYKFTKQLKVVRAGKNDDTFEKKKEGKWAAVVKLS